MIAFPSGAAAVDLLAVVSIVNHDPGNAGHRHAVNDVDLQLTVGNFDTVEGFVMCGELAGLGEDVKTTEHCFALKFDVKYPLGL